MRLCVLAALALVAGGSPAGATTSIDYLQPVRGPIVRHFEPPPTPFSAGHRGLDFAAPYGSPVYASADGRVAFAGQVGGDRFVSIDHADGLRTTYSFLSAIAVGRGQAVVQGQLIARSGDGHAAGEQAHLHFGLKRGDEYLDPEPVLLRALRRNVWRVLRLVG